MYFVDECGVDHRLRRLWARAPRGEAVFEEVHGSRRGRTSVISASRDGRLVEPMAFDGGCDGVTVGFWLASFLLPSIPRGSLIVLDNASFHRSESTLELVEAAGCFLLFLPKYSPDLNPIEHIWAALKKTLQNGLPQADDKQEYVAQACQCYC